MPKSNIRIDETNIYEWLCSTGSLLPSTETELARFEKLHPDGRITVNASAIDPFAIISGTREKKELSWNQLLLDETEQDELRLAARRHSELPDHILERIKKNQQKSDNQQRDDTPDRPENP